MTIVSRRPRNPSLRFQTFIDTSDLTKKKPEKSLVVGLKKTGGRNAYGRITTRYRGGGAAQLYRMVDFKRTERDIEGKIIAVEYDPNRNTRIALISFLNGAKKYILMPDGLKVGDTVIASATAEAKTGNCLPLKNIPSGFLVHNIEITPGSGGKFARGAGTSAQLVAKSGDRKSTRLNSSH